MARDTVDKEALAIAAIADAAVVWWKSKAPLDFDEAQHVANPTINCLMHEKQLAQAVAVLIRLDRAGI